jgi:hypothetical protein
MDSDLNVPRKAQKILGLTDRRARGLFDIFASGWSSKARIAYTKASDVNDRANAAAMELDRLIKLSSRKKSVSKSKSRR